LNEKRVASGDILPNATLFLQEKQGGMAFHIFVFPNFVCTLKIKGHATDKGRIQGRTDSRLAGIFDRRVEARPFGPRALHHGYRLLSACWFSLL
jgi:hypothetical protein